jgi:hypothetical protein
MQALAARWHAVQEPDAKFAVGREAADRLAALVNDELRPIEEIAHRQYAERAVIVAEMRAVQTRIVALRDEEEAAKPEERRCLSDEFDALIDQQADLAQRLATLV